MNPQPARAVELLQVAAPGMAPFVLAADPRCRRFVPYLRDHRIWEPDTSALLRGLAAPGMHAVDAGAHLGYHSILLSRRVGPEGRVSAFEPDPDNRRLLQANLLLNDCRNVEVHAAALGDGAGRARLARSPDNLGDHRLLGPAGRDGVEVDVTTLDQALAGAVVDLVKIDTQGSEPFVLAGMVRVLDASRARLALVMELAPGLLADRGVGLEALADRLEALDARVYAFSLSGRSLALQPLRPLAAGLAVVARELAVRGEHDASRDLLVFFDAGAERAHLARLGIDS